MKQHIHTRTQLQLAALQVLLGTPDSLHISHSLTQFQLAALQVLLGTPDSSVIVVKSELEAEDMQLGGVLTSPPLMFSVSPGGKYLAVLGEDGG